jgi:hypothetical protein
MVRRWRLIGYFPILYYPCVSPERSALRVVEGEGRLLCSGEGGGQRCKPESEGGLRRTAQEKAGVVDHQSDPVPDSVPDEVLFDDRRHHRRLLRAVRRS